MQKKTFTKWINQHLMKVRPHAVACLFALQRPVRDICGNLLSEIGSHLEL